MTSVCFSNAECEMRARFFFNRTFLCVLLLSLLLLFAPRSYCAEPSLFGSAPTMGNNPGESHSLRSLSPSYSAHPAVPDADFSAIGTDFENTHTRHRHSNASRGHAYEIIGHDPIQRSKASPYNRLADDSWALEIFAWLLGAVTLAILITVLAVFNTKPLSQWNSSVSVNTLVNVLTTISSTALIFPIGSSIAQLRWLWLRRKERVLADFDSFGPGPVQVFVMVFKHPKM